MMRINIHEAKTHLSRYLDRLRPGEVLLICRRNVPVAEIRIVAPARTGPRPVGLAKGTMSVPASFFEPLPKAFVEGFEGRGRRDR